MIDKFRFVGRYVPAYAHIVDFVDMFPYTGDINDIAARHVETVVLMSREEQTEA